MDNWMFEGSQHTDSPQLDWHREHGASSSPNLHLTSPGMNSHGTPAAHISREDTPNAQASAQFHQDYLGGMAGATFGMLGDTSSPHSKDWSELAGLEQIDMNFFPHDRLIDDPLEHHQLQQQLDQQAHADPHAHAPAHAHSQSQSQLHTNQEGHNVVPPTPTSFEVVAQYANDTSFMGNFDSPMIDSTNTNSIRPDVVFTPLVSPAVTPMESMINMNNGQNKQVGFFSPLTSPALEAKSPRRLKKNPSVTEDSKKKYTKRKTPGSTPIVGPTIPGRIAKQSPIIKARRSSSYSTVLNKQQQQQQQQQQLPSQAQTQPLPQPQDDKSMAPPKTRTRTKSGTQPATPATLMNFKNGTIQSPVILPSNDTSHRLSMAAMKNNTTTNANTNNNNVMTTLSEDDDQDPSNKKTSHKLAEQGRRNRMNQALVDLGALIPEDLQSTVAIPSKATTVELANQYIRTLSHEVEQLREKLRLFQGSDDTSNDSISPLETTQHSGPNEKFL